MQIKISIRIGGEQKGSKIVETPCIIGRSKGAGLTIPHPSVSRQHCEIYEEDGQLFLRDNGSLNGTLLKGDFVEEPVPLQSGDEFVIGELQLHIELATKADADTKVRVFAALESAAEIATMIEPPRQSPPPDVPPIIAGSPFINESPFTNDDELRLAPE